ncbi:MAG: LuxR C-terminal-related transcriptional regulator [Dehalococcoidia bacterium]|nr:LuxR C-terminal-related transcriptional regulator [Dehalococcoidia bacterium]
MKQNQQNLERATDFIKKLSPRQKELVDLMALGYRNDKIAQEMGLKLKTVKNTIRPIFKKLKPSVDEDPRAAAVMLWYVYYQH